MPELIRALDPEVAGPAPAARGPMALEQALGAHHPLGPLAGDRSVDLPARERRDHPGAVGRVGLRDLDNRPVDRPGGRSPDGGRPLLGGAVDRLAADLHDARRGRGGISLRDKLAGPGDALSHSQPRNASPAISSS